MGTLAFFEKTFSPNGGKSDKEKEKEGGKDTREASPDTSEGMKGKMSQVSLVLLLLFL